MKTSNLLPEHFLIDFFVDNGTKSYITSIDDLRVVQNLVFRRVLFLIKRVHKTNRIICFWVQKIPPSRWKPFIQRKLACSIFSMHHWSIFFWMRQLIIISTVRCWVNTSCRMLLVSIASTDGGFCKTERDHIEPMMFLVFLKDKLVIIWSHWERFKSNNIIHSQQKIIKSMKNINPALPKKKSKRETQAKRKW